MRARRAERQPRSSSAATTAVALVLALATASATPSSSECNSLNGPFCTAIGATNEFASYMTPISVDSLNDAAAHDDSVAPDTTAGVKQCFFQHFARSWMDSGGDEFDVMNKDVQSVDECEALCCAHPHCKSFSFWMGRTCFLRSRRGTPRSDGNSFSGNRIG